MEQKIKILYSDSCITVCIKPQCVSSEDSKAPGIPTLLAKGDKKLLAVHRLDREVSGVMVYANDPRTAAELSRQITDRTFEKEYLAVVSGEVDEHGVFEDLLYHDRVKNKTYTVKRERKGVKPAKLEFWRVDTTETENGIVSLVRIRLFTGRTHQIRVQFASRKHPILGDRKYGSDVKCQVALFSRLIGFETSGKSVKFTAIPENIFPWNLFTESLQKI